jgi:hypothetical protein
MVAACNPSYARGRDWEDHGTRPALANSLQDAISTNGRAQWCTPVITPTQGSTNRRIVVQAIPGIKQDCVSKTTNTKEASGIAQMVQCMSSKGKALSLIR